jgi:hypothetical protein
VPSLDLRFADNKSLVDAVTGQQLVTHTRASSGTFVDSAGVIQTAATDVPRFDHNPTTGESLGLLVEEQRTNGIRNNTMVGAVAGTPGTLPTNWAISGLGTLTQQVVSVGTAAGISYIDIRFSGTTSNTSLSIRLETNTGAAATNGQTFTHSFWSAVVGGSTFGVTLGTNANLYDSGGVFVGGVGFTGATVNTASTLLRTSGTGTIATANTAFIQPQLFATYANGAAIDITLRIGLPQLEQGATVSSVIPTTTAAVTRSADVASITGSAFSSWYRQDEGTWLGQYAPIYNASATVPSSTPHLFQVYTTASANNLYSIRGAGASTSQEIFGRNPTVGLVFANNSGVGFGVAGLLRKVAMGIDSAFIAAATNNSAITAPANTVAALMAAHDILTIGTGTTGGSPQQVNSHIRRLTFWGQRLPNNILQSITQ